MTTSWDSLYLPSGEKEAILKTLQESLIVLGYELYDPFGLIPGKSYPQTTRLFITPPVEGWIRIFGSFDPQIFPTLSNLCLCLHLSLDDSQALIETYENGKRVEPQNALKSYVRPDRNLERNLNGPIILPAEQAADSIFDSLPDDLQSLAGRVDKGQAQKMFNRLSGNLMKKVAGNESDKMSSAARDLMSAPDWNSPGGQRIRALMGCLTVPANWREPDFTTLRDAYQLHSRRRRNPNAHLYPGDAETMAKVPDALNYTPVYAGRKV
jgi:hypothetical protein